MKTRKSARKIRRVRMLKKLVGTSIRPRVSVFRSDKFLYVQLIDDGKRVTLAGLSDGKSQEKNKIERARVLGKQMAEAAKKLKINRVVFDRSGYAYHGRVKALAEGLREGGLKF